MKELIVMIYLSMKRWKRRKCWLLAFSPFPTKFYRVTSSLSFKHKIVLEKVNDAVPYLIFLPGSVTFNLERGKPWIPQKTPSFLNLMDLYQMTGRLVNIHLSLYQTTNF